MRKLDNWTNIWISIIVIGAGGMTVAFAATLNFGLAVQVFLGWTGIAGIGWTVIAIFIQSDIRDTEQNERKNNIAKERLAIQERQTQLLKRVKELEGWHKPELTSVKEGESQTWGHTEVDSSKVSSAINELIETNTKSIEDYPAYATDDQSSQSVEP